jgi:hypothetical protein
VAHSSTSLFRLTPRARAKSLSRWCLVAGKRMVSVDWIYSFKGASDFSRAPGVWTMIPGKRSSPLRKSR